jgi:argininosuccinate lyase
MQRFSESVSFDWRLAPFDVAVSKAHAAMLKKIGLLTTGECKAIREGLDVVLKGIESGRIHLKPEFEDIHMNIEHALTERVSAAQKLHTARSRNDQVAADMRLFFKSACRELDQILEELLRVLLRLAEKNFDLLIPGYTHLQRAQPVSAAHYLLAYMEMFQRDRDRIESVAKSANRCPLGAGAVAGSTLPIDRESIAVELGFVDKQGRPLLSENSMDTVADRDLFIEFASACALCGLHLSRLAEDLILWCTAEFDFVSLPEAFTTGSSLMPHKKNPDSLELIRGKAARLQGSLQTLYSLLKAQPLTYNRDLQEDKPPVFDSFDQTLLCLEVMCGVLKGLTFKKESCANAAADPTLLATDIVEILVIEGVPFREAHHIVGQLVALSEKEGVSLKGLDLGKVKRVHPTLAGVWSEIFDIAKSLSRRENRGMPGPKQVTRQLARWRRLLR